MSFRLQIHIYKKEVAYKGSFAGRAWEMSRGIRLREIRRSVAAQALYIPLSISSNYPLSRNDFPTPVWDALKNKTRKVAPTSLQHLLITNPLDLSPIHNRDAIKRQICKERSEKTKQGRICSRHKYCPLSAIFNSPLGNPFST
jgi:hypothetical protein